MFIRKTITKMKSIYNQIQDIGTYNEKEQK